MRHVYSVIRYVPDPIRGEFINVGAVVGSDESSEWLVRQVENPTRARRLDERGSLPAVWSFIDRIGRSVDAHEEAIEAPRLDGEDRLLSEGWLEDLHRRHTNIVQVSAPMPIVADNAAEALDTIFEELVVDPERHAGGENKHPALAAVRRAYHDAGLEKNRDVHERSLMVAGEHRGRVDFAVTNGRVVQLTQTWSFRVADQDALAESVRAWGWTVNMLREHGGSIEVADGRRFDVPIGVNLGVVIIPAADEGATALVDARAVLEEIHASTFEIGAVDEVANEARQLLSRPASRRGPTEIPGLSVRGPGTN